MKVKISNYIDFQPVTVSVTIETRDELLALWARGNCPASTVKDAAENHGWGSDVLRALSASVEKHDFFWALDEIKKKL